jgi:hypothetical protein
LILETEPLASQVRLTNEKLIVDLVDRRSLTHIPPFQLAQKD